MPDWGKLANSGLGKIEHGIDWSKKKVGEGVDWAAHQAGDALEHVGADGIADAVEDWADDFASGMGAHVAEQQLGQTEEANELVHGDPDKIRGTAKHLTTFRGAFERVGEGMKALDSSHWKGEAADAFRAKFATHPVNWLHAADACEKAAAALDAYATTVTWAQSRAKEAALLYKEGKRASEDARDDFNTKADTFNAKLKAGEDPGPRPAPFSDPGKGQRERAAEILREARRQRNEAAETARAAVAAALAHAPKEPPPLARAKADVMDSVVGEGIELAHFGGGIAKGTGGLLNFVRGLDPLDPYNITHPADYYKHVNMTLAGLTSAAVHPDRTFDDMWESAKKDPSEFTGRMVPELIGGKGGGLLKGVVRAGAKDGAEGAAGTLARPGEGPVHPEVAAAPKDWSALAEEAPGISEKAIHADSVPAHLADEFIDDQYPWLRDINNTGQSGYLQNCSHNVVAVDKRLDGIEVSAAPREFPDHPPPEALGIGDRGPGVYDEVGSYDELIKDLKDRGVGARSIVYIGRPDYSAHVFNAVNTPSGVVFLDGQPGYLARLEPGVSIAHIPYRSP
ncbi:putative T7SS-secreted protein [Streptomyces melanogenes]|uniref:putative T7SS-secreted protein n=1 Tax=Streptomyces melanogenes TaxID=67326 RepID=UPI0037B4A8E6